MTRFIVCGFLGLLGMLLLACGTLFIMLNFSKFCEPPCDKKRTEAVPPFLKIKKLGIRKEICSAHQKFFQCDIIKSHIELRIARKDVSCKEFLSRISGNIRTQELDRIMLFQGNSGLLDYLDGMLSIHNCCFRIDSLNEPLDPEDRISGGMKTFSLSLLRK